MNILDIHKNCFLYLYNHEVDGEKTLFVPRRRNSKKQKKEDGYYFIGNSTYLQISFWDGGDSKEKIHNIGFVILKNGSSYLEISSCDDDLKGKLLSKLVDKLKECFDLNFEKASPNKEYKWIAHYEGNNYLENLESFLSNEKEKIDEFVKNQCQGEIKLLDNDFYKKYVEDIKINYLNNEVLL